MISARDQLAAAHGGMTPDQIAENALQLAQALSEIAENYNKAVETLRHGNMIIRSMDASIKNLMAMIRDAQNLNATHRKSKARELIAGMAALSFVSPAVVTEDEFAAMRLPLSDIEHLFSPREFGS